MDATIVLIICLTFAVTVSVICVFSYLGCVGQAKIDKAAAENRRDAEYLVSSNKTDEIRRLQSQIEKMLEKQPTVAIKNL